MCGFYSNPTADWSLHALVIVDSVGIPSSWRRRKNFRPVRSLSCSPGAPFKEKAIAGERVSILSFRLADPASSVPFLAFHCLLPLSKENFELALGFTFIVSCRVAKKRGHFISHSHTRRHSRYDPEPATNVSWNKISQS